MFLDCWKEEDNFFYILKSYYLKRNLNRGHYLAERIYQATYKEGNFEQSVRAEVWLWLVFHISKSHEAMTVIN